MLDLGASINVIPYAIYEKLKLGPLKDTSVVIQLVDRSSVYPKGVVENVMVGVGKLVFPADLCFGHENEAGVIPVLLGRPFLKTAGTKIDVSKGSLTMEFNGTVVKFEITKPNSHSPAVHSLCAIDTFVNHDLSKCRKSPIPRKVSTILQESPPKYQICVIL
ncbi:uncharacterized protein LOC141602052 [Silene latifolia]|uniref:uncharacterized protein LOC141602052 n=1 Tax=Silene latifolia TaxID=37657 RepID=UPI003D76C1D8